MFNWLLLALFSVLPATAQLAGPTENPLMNIEALSPECMGQKFVKARAVTHYMIPLLDRYDKFHCDQLEGTCIYQKEGQSFLHNYGYRDQPLSEARCKNGYGNMSNCLHPCRVVAASMKHHRFGQIIFMKELVGQRCGNLQRDGFEMIHDGYVVVYDTGSPKHFNAPGRFDYFWGRCKDDRQGVCHEGGVDISAATTRQDYCVVWDPRKPLQNEGMRAAFENQVRFEAIRRGDNQAASDFDLTKTIGPDFGKKSQESQLSSQRGSYSAGAEEVP